MHTSLEMQEPVFQQFSSPTNSTIDESPPISPSAPSRALPVYNDQDMRGSSLPQEKGLGAQPQALPVQRHPAFMTAYTEDAGRTQQSTQSGAPSVSPNPPHSPGPIPIKRQDDSTNTTPTLQSTFSPESTQGVLRRETYNPHSLQGPNVDPANHRPGQVSHPNATVDPHWRHGLCEPDILCWFLAAIHRTRIRKAYKIQGSFCDDYLSSLCCCCCVVAQNEREVKEREESFRRHAGPVTGAFVSPTGGMVYAPPPD
ncbi:MAG: hypothetical protein Q9163_003061 [Psora crenata]